MTMYKAGIQIEVNTQMSNYPA